MTVPDGPFPRASPLAIPNVLKNIIEDYLPIQMLMLSRPRLLGRDLTLKGAIGLNRL